MVARDIPSTKNSLSFCSPNPEARSKIQDQAQGDPLALLRLRHNRKEEQIEDVLSLALDCDEAASGSNLRSEKKERFSRRASFNSSSSSSSIYNSHIETAAVQMAPYRNSEETASFLPSNGSGDHVLKTKLRSGFLSRVMRKRRTWIAVAAIIFITVQILAWGPELMRHDRHWRDTLESWQSVLTGPHDDRPPPPFPHDHPPPPFPHDKPTSPVPHDDHAAPSPQVSIIHPSPAVEQESKKPKQPLPKDYEEPSTLEDDLISLSSSSFPVKLANYYTKTHKAIDQTYPKGDPHLGVIPSNLLAILDRDIPQTPPPRPTAVPDFPSDYIPHSGWSAEVNGSTTSYLDALEPDKQSIEVDWRGAPFDKWRPPLKELSTGTKKSLPKVQYDFSNPSRHSGSKDDSERDRLIARRQRLVKNAFLHSWEGYKRKAWGHDEIRPVSETAEDPFNGWGATIVDALDTLLVMNLPIEYDYARQHVRDIDFHLVGGGRSAYSSSDGRVPVFETAIRYLGGFLSAYDLSGDTLMKDRAEELAQLILPAFDTSSGVPVGRIKFDKPGRPDPRGGVILAEAGSMLLELTRLWQVTGNRTYFDRVQRTTDWLDRNMTNTPTRLGTLWPTTIFPDRGTMYGWYTWGGMADSAFEYLIKEHQLLGGQLDQYGRMFAEAVDSARQWILRSVTTVTDTPLLVMGQSNGNTFEPKLEHLTCFAGGSLALSGKLLPGRERDFHQARRFTETCYWAYNSTLTGIGPESCTFYKEKDVDRFSFAYEKDGTSRRGNMNGAPIVGVRSTQTDYRNRPETIESVFYLWRTSGDPIWQERGWQMFSSWVTHSMTNVGFSSLSSVFEVPAQQTDSMESFVFAETFKYYYLLFSPPDVISLDDYVFTTEAHPLLLPKNGIWARPGSGPQKMWDPNVPHTPRDPKAYPGGEMGQVGALTAAQKTHLYLNWQADFNRKAKAKANAALGLAQTETKLVNPKPIQVKTS